MLRAYVYKLANSCFYKVCGHKPEYNTFSPTEHCLSHNIQSLLLIWVLYQKEVLV